jgi:guanyl-specific ribonuclease Sa
VSEPDIPGGDDAVHHTTNSGSGAGPTSSAAIAMRGRLAEFVVGVRIRDKAANVVAEGTVDLRPTIERIRTGGHHGHHNDGRVFKNRGGHLPAQADAAYYREFVHPTPLTVTTDVGPQRVVVGKGGEWYYTPDHYATFIPLN